MIGAARLFVDVFGDFAAGAENDGRCSPMPDPEQLRSAGFGVQEQGLVESKVGRESRQGEIEEMHGSQWNSSRLRELSNTTYAMMQ